MTFTNFTQKLQEFKMIHAGNPHILNIPSQQNFFESLFEWLIKNFSKEIANVKIFLPNHRSCREFHQVFLQKTSNKSLILPKIRAISDISYEDFFDFLPSDDIKKIIDELLEIKVISGIDHLFFLSQKIQKLKLFGDNLDANQALNIATQLENLFNEIERDEINLDILSEIDDSDLSLHRQVTLEFLKSFHIQIKNSLIKDNVLLASSYQNFIVNKFVESLTKSGSEFPLIIAGSTGSLSAGKKLIKAISKQNNAKQNNGFVILHGFNKEAENLPEHHPQFLLNELIKFLEIKPEIIEDIYNKNSQLSSQDRLNFITTTMLPSEESLKWQNLNLLLDVKKVIQDLEKNFKIIVTKDELEEARIVSMILAEAVSQNKKCTVITNNPKLSQLLKYELNKISLNFNDSRNIGLSNSKLANFILLILELLENDFASYELLAVLKNPLFKNGKYSIPIQPKESDLQKILKQFQDDTQNVPNFLHPELVSRSLTQIIKDFEINILRQERSKFGIIGIEEKLKLLNNPDLSEFFANFYNDLSKLINLPNSVDISFYLKSLISVIENLTANQWQNLLEKEDAQIELFEFFEKLKLQNNFIIDSKNALQTFRILFSQISYFQKSDSFAPIQILATIEARLINCDLVIISSLNEGDFPEIESENWLGKKIKKDLGIDKKLKKVGQNAYDFCNYLCNESVVLTRSLTKNGSVSICSPFLLKFETLCKKLEIKLDSGQKYFELLKRSNSVKGFKIERPQPKPDIKFRPKKLAVTDISKLRSDPYSIYAKKILQLKELQKIDFEPSYAEFGSFIHKALEEFIKNPQKPEKFLENSYQIFEKYFISTQAKLVWWPKFESIFNGFLEQESQLQNSLNYTEIPVKLVLNEILINGKIDRITLGKDGSVAIFDYKTGQVSNAKDVILGNDPQLTIAALMLVEGVIENSIKNIDIGKIDSLNYWKLSASSENEIKEICKKNEEIAILIMAAKAGISKLFEYFTDENNGYISAPNLQNYFENEYCHLARVKEWS